MHKPTEAANVYSYVSGSIPLAHSLTHSISCVEIVLTTSFCLITSSCLRASQGKYHTYWIILAIIAPPPFLLSIAPHGEDESEYWCKIFNSGIPQLGILFDIACTICHIVVHSIDKTHGYYALQKLIPGIFSWLSWHCRSPVLIFFILVLFSTTTIY